MALRLLYGSSVSQKTEVLYDMLIRDASRHPERNFMIVVPEQASLQVQEAIVLRHPRHAVSNIDILTFNRLAYRVFEETGAKTREILDDYGKIMLLRLVTLEHRNELSVLSRGISKPGMLDELKSVISELAQYNISPELLSKKAEELGSHPPLQKKLADLALIYRAFMTAVHENREIAEERIARLAECIGQWKGARNTTVAFDGFTGFTTPQYEVLRALLRECPEVIVGVTAGGPELSGGNQWFDENEDASALFYMSRTLASGLKELAITENVEYSEASVSERGDFAPEILHIEAKLYRSGKAVYPGENEAVRLVKARRRKDEVAWVLHEIMKGIREDGLRPRDFAVIAGDLSGDREEVEEQFSAAGIPCFIDMRKPIGEDPLVRLLLDALRTATSGFSFDAALSFAKNPIVIRYLEESLGTEDAFTPYERIAEVENFARARGFRFRPQYEKEWSASGRQFYQSRFPMINETKNTLFGGLFAFDDHMKAASSVRERIEAVRTLLQDYQVENALDFLSKDSPASEELAGEYRRVLEKILSDLGRFEAIFEGRDLDRETFSQVLEAGLQSLVMGHVPPTKDRVVIGDLRRTRLGKIRRLFVIGANEGVLPADHAGGGLLTDHDREILREEDIALSATAREMAAEDRYYLYLLLTKPLERLTILYRSQDDNGGGMLPGELAGMLKGLFPGLQEEETDRSFLSELNSREGGIGLVSASMREYLEKAREGRAQNPPGDEARALFRHIQADPLEKADLDRIFRGLFYAYRRDEEMLSPETAKRLWSGTLNGSVSFFEKYAEGPYGHFLNYGLKLEDPAEYEIDAADLGTVLHDTIDGIFSRTQDGTPWHQLGEEEREALIRDESEKVLSKVNNGIFLETARQKAQIGRVVRIVSRTMKALKEQWEAGSYEKTRTELSFGYDDALPGLTVPLSDGRKLALRGRIDRMDTLEEGNDIFVKIIDYKSTGRKLDFTKVWYGLQLQLPLYLRAAIEMEEREHPGANVIPGGLYYYGIKDPVVEVKDTTNPKTPEQLISDELRMSGVTNADPDAASKLDAELNGRVVPGLQFKKSDGTPYKSANVASGGQLRALGDFAMKKAKELAEELILGRIPVQPYEYQKKNGCEYCSYKGICGFDRFIDGYQYKTLEPKKLEQIAPMEEPGDSGPGDKAEGMKAEEKGGPEA